MAQTFMRDGISIKIKRLDVWLAKLERPNKMSWKAVFHHLITLGFSK
ncbi:hypothetical protein CCACVL1_26692 [Corchorus capsularis]|uniref:Uncharacterized protein n=1 Tax=Corchorus capsularis TaxID=210143 RepID=A0A1R3GDQ0_COCAP|nr:hypothetical protein CCACVL1_26692 [Corchorus capsularis]